MNNIFCQQDVPSTRDSVVENTESKGFSIRDMIDTVKEFWDDTKELFQDVVNEFKGEKPSEYHLKDTIKAAEKIFTPEVIKNWGQLPYEQRDQIIRDYAKGVGNALGIDYKGVVYENLIATEGAIGCNNGDGIIHLDYDCIYNPALLMNVIDTVAHEEFHQFQSEAIASPEKFNVDEKTINEWIVGDAFYTIENPSAYDPWGYFYNPLETGARHYGESVVRELTKDLVNA